MNKLMIGFAVLLTILVGCQHSDRERDVYEIYIACDSPADTVTYYFMEDFAKRLEEKSNGRLKAYLYPSGQLGSDTELIEAVQNGNITFVVQTTAPQVNFIQELAIFDIPNAFGRLSVARKVLDGPLFEALQKIHESYGIRLYAYADQGFREMTSNKKIETIEDFKGIKIRTMENPYHIKYWKSIGANPTPMNFGEVYIGLQQKTIDAQENPIETTVSAKLYEQQDYVVMTDHVLHTLSLIGSPKIIDRLPKELREILPEAAQESKEFARKKTDERTEGRLQIIRDSQTEVLMISDEMKEELLNLGKPAEEMVRNRIGNELVDLLFQEVEKAKESEK